MPHLSRRLLRTFYFFSLLILCQQVSAQKRFRLTGQVIDATTGEGVPFATVSLLDSLSRPVAAWATDGNGKFDYTVNISGKYRASAASLGYAPAQKEVTIEQSPTDLGRLEIVAGVELEEVVVSAIKPLVKTDIDKISYNVEADPEAPVNTVLDVLRKVPLVSVDAADNVQLQGQSNYKVLVNGKSSSLMDRSFKDVARSMPASAVKNIEVITNPSSRYEAEGVGGIINIITNRRIIGGYNGSLGFGADTYGSAQLVGYLNATAGKFSISGYLAGILQRRPYSKYERYQENYLSDEYHYEHSQNRNRQNLNALIYSLEASYEIDERNLITFSILGQNIDAMLPNQSGSIFTDMNGNPVRNFTNDVDGNILVGFISGNIDYQHTFTKPGRLFTASYKLSSNPEDNKSTSQIVGILNYPSYWQRSQNDTWSSEHTLQIDYVDPITNNHAIETGTKFILRRNGSDPDTYNRQDENDPWELDPLRRNALDYDQYILGIYGAYTYSLKKFSAKAGIRLENTWNDGLFSNVAADVPFDNNQFNVVPYATLSYAPKPTNRYSLSYTQRLSRPSIWYMNPYVNNTDPMNISFGNPSLDTEVAHTFNATYGLFGTKTNLNLTANVSFVNNSIERLFTADPEGITTATYLNIGQRDRYALSAYYSWRPNGKFNASINIGGSYVDIDDGNQLHNSGFAYNGNISGRVALWKGGAITANAYYSSPSITLQGQGMTSYSYGFGLSQQAFNQKLTFSVSANMPFQKYLHYYTLADAAGNFYRRSDTWNSVRLVRFNVSWNFGKTQVQVKKARRNISNDDLKSGGGVSL